MTRKNIPLWLWLPLLSTIPATFFIAGTFATETKTVGVATISALIIVYLIHLWGYPPTRLKDFVVGNAQALALAGVITAIAVT